MLKQHLVNIIEEDEKARNKIHHLKRQSILIKFQQPRTGCRNETNQ